MKIKAETMEQKLILIEQKETQLSKLNLEKKEEYIKALKLESNIEALKEEIHFLKTQS